MATATKDALANGRALDKNELHEELRTRVRADLMPWCRGCGSYHVAPMLWRYATVKAGVRLDSERRDTMGTPGRTPPASEAARRFLGFYGPAKPVTSPTWPGSQRPMPTACGTRSRATSPRCGSARARKPNRPLLAPDPELRKRLFRPVASPGAVLRDGRLAGLWRVKARGRKAEVTVETLGRLPRGALEEEARRVAELRGAAEAALVLA